VACTPTQKVEGLKECETLCKVAVPAEFKTVTKRVPVVVEAAAAIVMADLMMQSQTINRIVSPKTD
jgi:ABC-type enterochelin transport system permease subunit